MRDRNSHFAPPVCCRSATGPGACRLPLYPAGTSASAGGAQGWESRCAQSSFLQTQEKWPRRALPKLRARGHEQVCAKAPRVLNRGRGHCAQARQLLPSDRASRLKTAFPRLRIARRMPNKKRGHGNKWCYKRTRDGWRTASSKRSSKPTPKLRSPRTCPRCHFVHMRNGMHCPRVVRVHINCRHA